MPDHSKIPSHFPVIATLCMMIGVAILIGLGTWQLIRLQEKKALIANVEAGLNADPALLSGTDLKNSEQALDFRRVMVTGRYDFARQVFITPRSHNSQPGQHIITPLIMADGSTLLVNRGWAPLQDAAPESIQPAQSPDLVTLEGILRPPPRPTAFTPVNDPARGQWYQAIPDEIAAAQGLSQIAPYILYAAQDTPGTAGLVPVDGRPVLRNNHLQYAFFWFTMASVLIMIYALRFFPRRKV